MSVNLQEIVDIAKLLELAQFFFESVGVPLRIVDKNKQSLIALGEQPICSGFHRFYPQSQLLCQQNLESVFQRVDGDALHLTCPLGLEMVAVPIRLRGSLLGVFFLSPYLYVSPDGDYFRRQAQAYGYDQPTYLQALEKVPIVARERIDFWVKFFQRFIGLLVQLGDENRCRLKAEQEVRQAGTLLEQKVAERTDELNSALNEVSDLAANMNTLLRQVETMAVTDTLTETYNRRKFDEVAVIEQQRALHDKLPFSVIMLDIDHFKRVNDQYGHSAGDQVLKYLCDVVRSLIRQGDMLIRWGGEEFLIVLPATQFDEAAPLAKRIRLEIKQEHFPSVGQLTVSLGVAQLRTDDSIDSLIQRVDQALYRAKQTGRDRVVYESPHSEAS